MRCMYMSKMAVVIDMLIQFIAELAVLFYVTFGVVLKSPYDTHPGFFIYTQS